MKNIGRIITIGLLAWTVSAGAQPVDKKTLTLSDARLVIAAAVAEAKRLNAPGGVIAVVDDGGNLMALERLDGTFAAGANISIGKARTSALFKKPTRVFEDIIKNGRTAMVALPDSLFTPLQGGVPIMVDDQVVGAVGVSGAASAQQDEELAIAGAKALAAPGAGAPVTYLERSRVTAAFVKGAPLFETETYKVHASRREASGQVEVHEHETDVFYVLQGSATFVTGGTVTDPKVVAPGEIRGSAIRGGETRRLTQGDVIVVPRGVPHWFRESDNPFLYFVVKPIS
jgi:glc operon protein GlcG